MNRRTWLRRGGASRGVQAMKAYQDVYGIYAGLVGAFYRRPAPPPLGQALASMGAAEGAAAAPRARSIRGSSFEKVRFEKSIQSLAGAAATLRKIEMKLTDQTKAEIVASYRVEVRRLGSFLSLLLQILECTSAYDDFRSEPNAVTLESFSKRIQALRRSQAHHAKVVRELEDVRFTASLPRFVPYEQKALRDVEQFANLFSEMEHRGRKGETTFMPEIVIASGDLFATRLGMTLP